MNTEYKEDLPVQSLRFNAAIPDERLRYLLGDAEIVRINRGSWHCFVEFRSNEKAKELEEKIEAWYTNMRDEINARNEIEHRAKYREFVDKYCSGPGIPAIQTRRGKPKQEGYCYQDDNNKWVFVFSEE